MWEGNREGGGADKVEVTSGFKKKSKLKIILEENWPELFQSTKESGNG